MRHLRQALVAMCGGLVMGCEPSPHDTAVEDAQKAASRGDLAVAAKRFTDACKMQTDDEESCAAAVKSTDAFGNMVMARAKVACEAGDAHTCAATFKDYRELRPTDVRMREMLGKAAAAHVEKCEALERPDSINSILERAKCAVSVQAEVRDSRYDRLIESEREHAAIQLVLIADARQLREAARYTVLTMAQCFWSKTAGADSSSSAQALTQAASVGISTRSTNAGYAAFTFDMCSVVQRNVGPRVHCTKTAEPRYTLEATLELGDTTHEVESEPRSVHYIAGTERYPNPVRPSVENDYYAAKRSFEQVEQETGDRQAACNRTQDRVACDAYHAAQTVYDRRKSDWGNAQTRLNATPAVLERDVYADAAYVVAHHRWSTAFDIRSTFGDGTRFADHGQFEDRDDETAGVQHARVAADPLRAPTRSGYEATLRERALTHVSTLIADRVAQRAVCARNPWNFDDDLECKALSEFYTTSKLPTAATWLPGLVCL